MEPETFEEDVTVRFVRYANEATGWAVLDAAAADGSPVALVGPLVHLEERERARVVGTWVDDSRYGPQVKVTEARPLPPDDPQVLVGYLRRIKHVGAKRAGDLVDRFGAASVLDAIDRDPRAAFAEVGLSGARADQASESWQTIRVTRRLHMLLAPHGLAYLARRIHEHYGDGAHEVLSANPYELTSVFGVGFVIADRIARASGEPVGGGRRERAAIMHVLWNPSATGAPACRSIRRCRQRASCSGMAARPRKNSSMNSWPQATRSARAIGSTARRPPSWRPSWPGGSTPWSADGRATVSPIRPRPMRKPPATYRRRRAS